MSTSSSPLPSAGLLVNNAQLLSNGAAKLTNSDHLNQSKKFLYQAAVQLKFLHLEAEVESLLQQLQTLKQQRLATAGYSGAHSRH